MLDPKVLVAALVLAALWIAESWAPFFPNFQGKLGPRLRHDAKNLAIGLFNGALLAFLLGGVFALEASWAAEAGAGLLRAVAWPAWTEAALALVTFDLWMYVWHRANHRLPFLWRFHRMHHSDPEMDATTAVRFHTGEVLFSGCARLLVVPALGMELWQLALYETLLLPVIILHHSNVRLPRSLDHGLLALVVTPAMHRVHHSRVREETDSNYGSILPHWDMILRTFRLRDDARTIRLGLDGLDGPEWQRLKGMLLTPLARPVDGRRGKPRHSAEASVKAPAPWSLILAFVLVPVASSRSFAEPSLVRVRSPGGGVAIELGLERDGERDAVPRWRLHFKGRPIVLASRLGFELAGGAALGGPCTIESVETGSRRAEYEVFPGKRRRVLDHFSEAVVSLRERAPPGRRWDLVLRAYDDGAALRYRFPAQEGWPHLVIAGERTEMALGGDAVAFALPLNGFTTSYERLYERKLVPEIPREWLLGLPLLLECPGRGWAAITEANLTEFGGMYLARAGEGPATLLSRLSPLPKEPKVAVKASLPHASPWRVVLLGDDPARLIESDLVLHLNEPCAIADTSWIRPGKTTFPWWNGYHLEGAGFEPGLNTETAKHYIDFCAESGIPYHSLDGLDNVAWYGGPIVPYRGADITRALPGLDLQGVIAHARAKGVRLRLWMHWEAARAHMDRAFPLYREWGIEGVMIDFMDRDDQEMVRFCRDLVRKAAENRLTVTLHGSPKPTGLERTYPNLLTSEGVLNLEYNKWDATGSTPEHEVTVPFTRMLAGPLDFHQGSFRGVSVERFTPRNVAPLVMGTPSRTLASYVVYQNHLPMAADSPSAYRGHPGLGMLARIPSSWDDTRVLSGKVGEHIVIGRRHGREWYVGAMNDQSPRALEVPLRFLDQGRYGAETFADGPDPSRPIAHRTGTVAAGDVLKIELGPAGGHITWLAPLDGSQAR